MGQLFCDSDYANETLLHPNYPNICQIYPIFSTFALTIILHLMFYKTGINTLANTGTFQKHLINTIDK